MIHLRDANSLVAHVMELRARWRRTVNAWSSTRVTAAGRRRHLPRGPDVPRVRAVQPLDDLLVVVGAEHGGRHAGVDPALEARLRHGVVADGSADGVPFTVRGGGHHRRGGGVRHLQAQSVARSASQCAASRGPGRGSCGRGAS